MPKFFYTVVAATLIAWTIVISVGSNNPPDSAGHILLFLFTLFIAVGITISALMFVYFSRKASLFMNRHILFRRALKYGYFASLFITGVLTLRAFDLDTVLNYILFTFLCLVLYKYFKGSRA